MHFFLSDDSSAGARENKIFTTTTRFWFNWLNQVKASIRPYNQYSSSGFNALLNMSSMRNTRTDREMPRANTTKALDMSTNDKASMRADAPWFSILHWSMRGYYKCNNKILKNVINWAGLVPLISTFTFFKYWFINPASNWTWIL